jgi:periplasmic divalent cation tolerance protein
MNESTPEFIQVITTIDSEQAARKLARLVVESRLGACVQVYGPIASVYRWQGQVEEATEWACLIKAPAASYPALEHLIKLNHTYTVPEILAVPVVAGSRDYLDWLRANTGPE